MRKFVRWVAVAGALLLALASVAFRAVPAEAASTATVSILHAIPGATVDVYANGKALLTDFKPGTLTDPQMLPATTYDLKVVKAGAGPKGKTVAEAKGVKVPAGVNVTVVAHLDAKGNPTLSPYVNDVSSIPAGQARLTVRHDAAAPAVDVRANKKVAFAGLTNPKEKTAVLGAGTISADVVLAGTTTVAIGPAEVNLAEGTTTIVYAWGSAGDENLKLAVQTISGMGSNPGGVPGGTGGQAATAGPVTLGLFGLALVGFAVAAGQLARRRAVSKVR